MRKGYQRSQCAYDRYKPRGIRKSWSRDSRSNLRALGHPKKGKNFKVIFSLFLQSDHEESENRGHETQGSMFCNAGRIKSKKSKKYLGPKDIYFCLWNFNIINDALSSWALRIDLESLDHDFCGRFGLYLLRNHEIMTLKFWPFLRYLGPGALRIDPRDSGPRFSDSPWSYRPHLLLQSKNRLFWPLKS